MQLSESWFLVLFWWGSVPPVSLYGRDYPCFTRTLGIHGHPVPSSCIIIAQWHPVNGSTDFDFV